ncbi:zincin [Jaminaea rosea]|uniref:Zincin n=1 Tax=Jaminaea rosea TaxID=1569628 RepID=A0A316V2N1_9BASI|nr:zincin [Jaminaea rosea]PWN30821.1 zincin [Jaminaea rosea]
MTAALGPLAEPEKLNITERLLLAVAVIFLLLAAIFIGLFAGAQSRLNEGTRPGGPLPPHDGDGNHGGGDGQVCQSKDCVLTSAYILQSIDDTVSPCDDFYRFAVGSWLGAPEHQIPADAGSYGAGAAVTERNSRIIRDIIQKAPTKEEAEALHALGHLSDEEAADNANLAKLKTYYDSCVDTRAQDKAGAKPLMDIVNHIRSLLYPKHFNVEDAREPLFVAQGGHHTGPLPRPPGAPTPLPPGKTPGRAPQPHPPSREPGPPPSRGPRQQHLTNMIGWAHSRGIPALWDLVIDGDPIRDPTQGTIYLSPGGLGLPDKEYYEDKREIKFYRNVVAQALSAVADEDHHKHEDGTVTFRKSHKRLARAVVDLEREIARFTPDGDVLADPVATYNPVSVNKLEHYLDSVNWPDYFSSLMVRVPQKVIVTAPDTFKRMSELVSRTHDDVIEAYLIWTAVRTFGLDLGPNVPLRAPADALSRRAKGVAPDAKEDREKVCLGALDEALGFMAGRYFVRAAFPPAARDKAKSIIESIISAFKARLPELDWLDAETRKAAEVKADNVFVKVGWPDSPNTTDAAAIQRYYSNLDVKGGDYFGNQLRSSTLSTRRYVNQASRKLDPLRWDMTAQEVNAYFNPTENTIVFPAGILQPPYFDYRWPAYLQYGAFGVVSGHELSHSFDPTGRLYDEKGYLRDWWTNTTAKEFKKRQDCLEQQYGNLTLDDGAGHKLPLNPKLTIGEDVADAGGMAQSFRAWQTLLSSKDDSVNNQLLPGLEGYTREQLFFIAYAISYARNLRPEEALRRIRTDPHSPNPFRTNAVVRNFEPFYEAWGCAKGDAMFTPEEERCHIW